MDAEREKLQTVVAKQQKRDKERERESTKRAKPEQAQLGNDNSLLARLCKVNGIDLSENID